MSTAPLVKDTIQETSRLESQLQAFRSTHVLKKLTVAGKQWEYYSSGRSPVSLLLLPGILGLAEMSFTQILAFESDYRVIVPSYPASLAAVAEMLSGIAAILSAEGIPLAHVIGSSYGGMLAQAFVRRFPHQTSRLVLSHTGAPKPDRVQANQKFIRLLRWLPLGMLRLFLRQVTRRSLVDAPLQRPFWEKYTYAAIASLHTADLISRYQVVIDFDSSAAYTPEDLSAWPGRILILAGDNDPITEAAESQTLKLLYPQAQLHVFTGSGHVATLAKLPEYVSVVHQFLSAP